MLIDREKNEILLVEEPNAHILITGKSGYGKTYCCNRLAENLYRQGKRILILDESSSYSRGELLEKNSTLLEVAHYLDPCEAIAPFPLQTEDPERAANMVAAALVNAFQIHGVYQRRVLQECCRWVFAEETTFTFPDFLVVLDLYREELQDSQGSSDMIDAATKLMDKFRYLEHFKNWLITLTGSSPTSAPAQVEILQLSGLSALCKEQMAVLVLELLWSEITSGQGALRYDTILIDEFQHLPFTESSVLNKMLREGRKFHLQLILSSQFISNYSPTEHEALNQVAHRLFFRPSLKAVPNISKYLGEETEQEWRTQLKMLGRGECVLSGSYRLAGRTRTCADPIVVRCT